MKNPFSLEGKIALVTGASYGIGYAIAKGLATAGAKIVFNDINEEFLNKGLEINFIVEADKETDLKSYSFKYDGGVIDFVKYIKDVKQLGFNKQTVKII